MIRGVIVLGGVPVLGLIAATDVAAGAAQAKVDPAVARLKAFLAAVGARPVGPDLVEVVALHVSRWTCHQRTLSDPGPLTKGLFRR